ncbi:GNAT family N-acetyltransferase [Brachybacterium endophyticum]|uniref:GNAT family N-acetyltransferase n=1 Tax=Brachybacterium endophyticum TaxID=2182385 RepID=A0A2U2RHV1_9MICO|nr:N-acetyltransferase [Brachybacterium endophyticum]PWH05447.1 GNAT family N-acetyltransferase [Brachybacterium endophyticum]
MLIRPETSEDTLAIRTVTAEAFWGQEHSAPPQEADGAPGEATLVGLLRDDEAWIPGFSLVAEHEGRVVGHVVATRAHVESYDALGLGPLSVAPELQRQGVGSTLMTALIDAADERGEQLIALLGDPAYYSRFGFSPAADLGIQAPDPTWGAAFQVRPLGAYDGFTGVFRYAEPFSRL